jgi:transposase
MANVLSADKKQQVIALGRLGWPLRRIERETGVRRETAGDYLKAAGIAVRPPRGWGRRPPAKPANEVTTDSKAGKTLFSDTRPSGDPLKPARQLGSDPTTEQAAHSKPANEVTTDSRAVKQSDPPLPPVAEASVPANSASACKPYQEAIQLALSQGRNAMSIWQELVDQNGFVGGYQSVKRFVRQLRGVPTPEARVVIRTAPGEEAQVDYGSGPMVRHPLSGKYRRTRLFVMTLGYSRKAVRLLVFRSSTRTWAELHEKAFRRLGGATRVVVLDNLGEGVLKPDIYDPAVNPLYRDVLAHYGAVALPCRVGDPNRKGKVESGVGYAKKTPLKGRRFESLEEAQAFLDHWEQHWADTRIHGTTKRQVAAMFAEERPALLPLPLEPFRYYQFGDRSVNLDGCVEVDAAYYSAPPGWIGRKVKVQWNEVWVRLLDPRTGQLLREHYHTLRGTHRIPEQDRPKRTPLTTHQLLWRTERAGLHIGQLCHALYDRDGQLAIRRILGVLRLAKKHGVAATEDACAAALEMGVPDYRFVRRYLDRGPQLPLTLRQVDPLIRELTQYRDLIDRRSKETWE